MTTPFERVSKFVTECKDAGQQHIVRNEWDTEEVSLEVADLSAVLRDAVVGAPPEEAKLPVPWSTTNEPAEKCRIYLSVLAPIRRIAREHGYAIAVHGSMMRDFDLVAIPWTEEAVPAHVLAGAIAYGICVVKADYVDYFQRKDNADASAKPHGRMAFLIRLGHHVYIDLSVMPRVTDAKPRPHFPSGNVEPTW